MALSSAQVYGVAAGGTAETIAVTSPLLNVIVPGTYVGMAVRGNVNLTTGSAATVAVLRVRQGTATSGTLIGSAQSFTVSGLSSYALAYDVLDTTVQPAAQYTVSVSQTSASTNGTFNQAEIETDLVVP